MLNLFKNLDCESLYEVLPVMIDEIWAKLPLEYHDFLDVFNKKKAEILPLHQNYNHKIKLEGEVK